MDRIITAPLVHVDVPPFATLLAGVGVGVRVCVWQVNTICLVVLTDMPPRSNNLHEVWSMLHFLVPDVFTADSLKRYLHTCTVRLVEHCCCDDRLACCTGCTRGTTKMESNYTVNRSHVATESALSD